jgi:hypothetical protein
VVVLATARVASLTVGPRGPALPSGRNQTLRKPPSLERGANRRDVSPGVAWGSAGDIGAAGLAKTIDRDDLLLPV